MPPYRRGNKMNAFTLFARELMQNSPEEISFHEAVSKADPIWKEQESGQRFIKIQFSKIRTPLLIIKRPMMAQFKYVNMGPDERAPYYDIARNERTRHYGSGDRRDTYGNALKNVEKDRIDRETKERNMKRTIESTVRNSVNRGEFEKQSYFLIMVNYFTRMSKDGLYIPAELSVSEFSLKDGVTRKYHTFVNPGVDLYGHVLNAQEHSNATHKLPIPPKSMGERCMIRVYKDIITFIGNDVNEEITPVYTHKDAMPIVESVLNFLKRDSLTKPVELPVYSAQHLLFIMKEASCEIGELPKIASHHMTDAYFENDVFEFNAGLSCNFHEELDKSKYCTQSIVTRWGYMFCDFMCKDIAITPIPGRHLPPIVKVAYAVIPGSPLRPKPDDNDYAPDNKRFKSNA